ncbi:hypothetical protein [Amycolatopsis anabasis]|uniref:hypothetical protein n=1 Tax=Amycolatopsis anabasis TaxID=1840409 RepID=UPI00131D7FFD|nr:hypothetical protein [Amycolatopsis anabasis]
MSIPHTVDTSRRLPAHGPASIARGIPNPPGICATADPWILYFERRGWTCSQRFGTTEALFVFRWGFQGQFHDGRVRACDPLDHGMSELSVEIALTGGTWRATITTCGVTEGCAEHQCYVIEIEMCRPDFPRILSLLEQHAATLDSHKLAYCLIFGACSLDPRYRSPQTATAERAIILLEK